MLEYFKLQYKMINRRIIAFGLHPVVAYSLLFLVFTGSSVYIFGKTAFAPYLYIFVALLAISNLSSVKRNDFLKLCFSRRNYRRVRVLENLILIFPFLLFLACKIEFYALSVLTGVAVLMAFTNFKISYSITFPTPFGKHPFEFTIGFRNTFYLFPVFYYIAIMAITTTNFNLGIIVLLATFLTVSFYSLITEDEYFVWVYSLTPRQFLIKKIKTAIVFSSFLAAPILIALGIFFIHHIHILLLFTILGYLIIIFLLFAKYSIFPEDVSFPMFTLLIICFMLPVMLFVILPYLGSRALERLKNYLA